MGFLFDLDGRSVVPVRALPWVTGHDGDRWHFGAVEVARALACDAMFSSFASVRARRADGSVVLASDWLELVSTLETRRAARDWDSDEWQVHATLLLPPGVSVDAAAWREAYQGSPDGPGPLLALLDDAADAELEDRADAEARSIDFERDVPDVVRALIIEGFETEAPPLVSSARRIHRVARDFLAPVIAQIQAALSDDLRFDSAAVMAQLEKLARLPDDRRPAPLLGVDSGGVQWRDGGVVRKLTRDALRERLRRTRTHADPR